ncbi:hypothetical protein [Nitratireductor thuwali]|uniref:Ribbon-helix-helix protein CopG domain-containing protein n=1 Tax=Nitratireductor thuwali TaxID=2267699 RepID=A0ABY5MNY3_9HYPH|nr:hypothetical protein NTH_04040 [Nitratireductor thuwali]
MADKNEQKKTERLHMLISPAEIDAIDDWRFRNKIGTRAEAVRRLCQISLEAETAANRSSELATSILRSFNRSMKKLDENTGEPPEEVLDIFESWMDELLPMVLELAASSETVAEIFDALRSGDSLTEALKRVNDKKADLEKARRHIERFGGR